MEITVRAITSNQEVVDRCRTTVWKDTLGHDPSDKFMDNIYFSEHSPIRDKMFVIEIRGIKSWVATHLCRHSVGYTPYISTQRDDRIDHTISRDEAPQGTLVNMDITLNAQAMINVSRKRLCGMCSPETRQVWKRVIEELKEVDPQLAKNCVPNCVYRGGICPEGKNRCKYNESKAFNTALADYLEGHDTGFLDNK